MHRALLVADCLLQNVAPKPQFRAHALHRNRPLALTHLVGICICICRVGSSCVISFGVKQQQRVRAPMHICVSVQESANLLWIPCGFLRRSENVGGCKHVVARSKFSQASASAEHNADVLSFSSRSAYVGGCARVLLRPLHPWTDWARSH